MNIPERREIKEIIRQTREKLFSLENAYLSCKNLADVDSETFEELQEFENASGNLIELFRNSYAAAEYLCGCGSELKIDREIDEEPACSQCMPNVEEIEYERFSNQ